VLRGQYASLGLLTDREAYLTYLERQMDSVRACVMAQQGVSDRVEQVASGLVSLEERLLSVARMVKLMQSYAEGQDAEQRKFRQALIKKMKEVEERFVTKSEENLRVATERMERRMEEVQAAMLKRAEEVIKEKVDRMVEDVVVVGQRELAQAMDRGMDEIKGKISASNTSESAMLRKAVGHLRTLIATEERDRVLMRKDMEKLCYDTAAKAARAAEDAARECVAQTHRALEEHGVGVPGVAKIGRPEGLTLDPARFPEGYGPGEPRGPPGGTHAAEARPGGGSMTLSRQDVRTEVATGAAGPSAQTSTAPDDESRGDAQGAEGEREGGKKGTRNLQELYQQLTDLEMDELGAQGTNK